MKHLYGRVHLAHAAFLFPLIRRSFLHALLGESAAERLLPQSSVSFLPQFLMDGEVERQGGLAVEEQARQQLVAQDVVLTHMVEHPGDMFQFPTVFFQGGIVKYDAGVPALCPDAVSPKKALKTEDGMAKQSAPVHRLPDHHAVIAVLAGGGKMMEVLLVHGVYCLTVNTKKTEERINWTADIPSCFSRDSLQSRCPRPNFEKSERISPLSLLLTLNSLDISLKLSNFTSKIVPL